MEHSQLGLERRRAHGSAIVLVQEHEIVFSLHARHNRCLVQERFDTERGRARVLERLTGLQNGLPSRHTGSLDNVLVGRSHRLDFEPARDELNRLGRIHVGDANVVRKAVLVLEVVGAFRAVAGGDLDADLVRDDIRAVVEGRNGNLTRLNVGIAGERRGGLGERVFRLHLRSRHPLHRRPHRRHPALGTA